MELTNICGLECSFCPTQSLPTHTMSIEFFKDIAKQLCGYCDTLYFHLLGDPIVLTNLKSYLDIAYQYHLKVIITTSGFFLDKQSFTTLTHPTLKQINFSLNSYNANATNKTFQEYMKSILEFCAYNISLGAPIFVNLRLWNLDTQKSAHNFNQKVFQVVNAFFGTNFNTQNMPFENKRVRISTKTLFDFETYFLWPNLNNPHQSYTGTCHGLISQLAIHSNGTVVPCCLDSHCDINLGNLHTKTLQEILLGKKAKEIVQGFQTQTLTQALCQKCTYRVRFEMSKKCNY